MVQDDTNSDYPTAVGAKDRTQPWTLHCRAEAWKNRFAARQRRDYREAARI
jgi:hypothetical protein